MKLVIKLAILTGQRRKEIAGMRCDELDNGVLTVAADVVEAGRIVKEGRMKNGREQKIYLSKQALALFDEAMKTCSDGIHFFPGDQSRTKKELKTKHIHPDSITGAMRDLCAREKIEDLRGHDMRRAITTWLDEQDVTESAQQGIMHHTPQDVTSKTYRKSKGEDRLRSAWQLWADHVETVIGPLPSGDCYPVPVAVEPGPLPD